MDGRAGQIKIGLLGDVMLGRGVAEALCERPPASLWSDGLVDIACECDLVVGNLECCISRRGAPTTAIPGKPFFFRAPPQAVDALRAANIGAVSLANNHGLDFGDEALRDTLELLERAGVASAGAGDRAATARRGAIVEAGGARVGLVALTDHPRAYGAGEESLGVALAELREALPEWAAEALRRMARDCDHAIAFPHWGPNMTTEPATWQRARAREMLEAGAALVAGHSAHVFHGVERHRTKLALYDLGDALDDYAIDRERRNDLGLLALWRPGGEPEVELVGLRLRYAFTEMADGADADWIAARLRRACAALGTEIERIEETRFAVR